MLTAMIIFGVLTIVCACGVVASEKPLNSALWLVLTLFLVAVHFALLGAHFVAAIQVMVYAGAIMVLVIFVIMLLGTEAHGPETRSTSQRIAASVVTAIFVAMTILVIQKGFPAGVARTVDGSTAAIGQMLFSDYLFPFELTSLLILAGIIGAVVLGHESRRPLKSGRGLKAKQVLPEEVG